MGKHRGTSAIGFEQLLGMAKRTAVHVAVFYLFYCGEYGFKSAYPPSDKQLLEKLERCNSETIGLALRPEVFRAAIAITAKACGRGAASPSDLAVADVDVSEAHAGGRTITGLRSPLGPAYIHDRYQPSEIHRYRRDDLLKFPIFDAPPPIPDLASLRNVAVFWAGDEGVLIYRKTDEDRSLPTVDMDYIARWSCLCHAIDWGGTHV